MACREVCRLSREIDKPRVRLAAEEPLFIKIN